MFIFCLIFPQPFRSLQLAVQQDGLLRGIQSSMPSTNPEYKAIFYLSVLVNLNSSHSKCRDFRNIIVLSLSFFLLQFKWNSTHRTLLNSLHKMRCKSSNLVSQSLWSNDGYFIANLLVCLEIKRKTRIIFLNNNSGSPLYSLCANSSLNKFSWLAIFLEKWLDRVRVRVRVSSKNAKRHRKRYS